MLKCELGGVVNTWGVRTMWAGVGRCTLKGAGGQHDCQRMGEL